MKETSNKIKAWLDEHKSQYLNDLASLIEIPSVVAQQEDGAPYGKECKRALCKMLEICEKYGFETKNFDNHIGTAILRGESDEIGLDVLSHLDVVAAGTGWDTDPFSLVLKDDFVYGRGVADDKGPALASLYSARAIKELGLLPKKSIKLIFGCAEETGSQDLVHYFETQKSAPYTFTPDGAFPVYNGEKGRYAPTFTKEMYDDTYLARVTRFDCGNAPNIVPERAECEIFGIDEKTIQDKANEMSQKLGVKYEVCTVEDNIVRIICLGTSAHASLPHNGNNALCALIELINVLPLHESNSFDTFKNLCRLFPHGETNGKSLGIQMQDELSGELTVAFSMLHFDGNKMECVCDMRLPFCATEDNVKKIFNRALRCEGFKLSGEMSKPHYVDKDCDFIKKLLEAYEITSQRQGGTFVMGGGTYVHDIEGGVAFGPVFGDYDVCEHGANECMKLQDLLLASAIYATAFTLF